ncbi:hypothetical protein [Jiella mangrovi]|uniref:Amino acid transporter n=1 Tax=Jiella mangrovi TaxID=2821407 RepID=A0ABS4BCN1_9HYPH|nr:hypothetical protein [Jiella mangrovi]MBP0614503.1 hypothetical protein [Jiella mangrovi]
MTLPTNEGLRKDRPKQPVDADIEAAKLTATFLNGLAVGLAIVGGVAPILNAIYTTERVPVEAWMRAVIGSVCFVVAVTIHLIATSYLKRELRK